MHKLIIALGAVALMASTASARDVMFGPIPPQITRVEINEEWHGCFGGNSSRYTIEKGRFQQDGGKKHTLSREHIEQLELFLTHISQIEDNRRCTTITTYEIIAYSSNDEIIHTEHLVDGLCLKYKSSIGDLEHGAIEFISPSRLAQVLRE